MYNEELKNKYLEDKRTLTKKEYISFFNKIEDVEKTFNKDLSAFILPEMEIALLASKPRNLKQLKVYCSIMQGYYNWANRTNKKLFKGISDEYFRKFVVKS